MLIFTYFTAFNKAFQFTSITSVAILDCWTIAWAIILTWIFLGTKYSGWQFFGAAVCVTGLCLVLFSYARSGGGGVSSHFRWFSSNPLFSDFLVITGMILFAMRNVGEEFCVKKKDLTEVIAMIGLFGMLVSASEMYAFQTIFTNIIHKLSTFFKTNREFMLFNSLTLYL
ncbi:Eukaryotic protein of unknown function (DUF914, partial [Striga hermonthica]